METPETEKLYGADKKILVDLLIEIEAAACGEEQVADDDTDCLQWIFERIEQTRLESGG